jgi:hypothetical protein
LMGHYSEDSPQPVGGSAAQIAEHLGALAEAGATHLQLVVDPITTSTIEALGDVLAVLDSASQ